MADNLIIKIDGDASKLEKELTNAAGTGVRAFKRFSDGTNEQLDRMQDMVDDVRMKLIEMGEDGEEAIEDMGGASRTALDPLLSDADQAKGKLQSLGNEGTGSMNKLESAAKKVGLAMKAIAGAAVVRKLVSFGKEAIGLASDLSEVQNVIDVTFGEGNGKIESFAKNAAKQYGISELSAKKMAGTMGAMLKSLDVKNVDDMSVSLVGLAADMGSFYNMDAEEAFAKLRSGISGETEPLKQLGINMSVANLEAYALSQGMKKQFKDMTAAEQATLRYQYIMKATADAQGDFTRTSGSMANQLKIAKLNIENIKSSLGQALLPTATAVTTAFNNALTNIQKGFPAIKEGISTLASNIRNEMDRLGIIGRIKGGLATLKNVLNQVIGFVISIFQAFAKSPALQGAKDALRGILDGFLGVWDSIGELLSTLWVYLEPVWEGLKAGVQNFVNAWIEAKTMIWNVVAGVYNIVKNVLNLVIGILTLDKERIISALIGLKDSVINIGKIIWKGIGTILDSIWAGVKDFLTKMVAKFKEKIGEIDLKKNGKELLDALKNGITEGWEKIKTWFGTTKESALKSIGKIDLKQKGIDILSTLLAGFITQWITIGAWLAEKANAIIQWVAGIDLKQKAINVLQTLSDGFTEAWTAIETWLSEKAKWILDTITGIDLAEAGKNIVESLKKGFTESWNSFVGTLENMINSVLDKLPDNIYKLLGIERTHISLQGGSAEEETTTSTRRGKQKILGVYASGTMTPEQALAAYEAGLARPTAGNMAPLPLKGRSGMVAAAESEAAAKAAEAAAATADSAAEVEQTVTDSTDTITAAATDAADIVSKTAGKFQMPSMLGSFGTNPTAGWDMRMINAAAGAAVEPTAEQVAAAAETTEGAAEAAADASDTAAEAAETAAAAAEAAQSAADAITDDGVDFKFDDSQMDSLLEAVDDIDLGDKEPNHVKNIIDSVLSFFGVSTDTLDKDLQGLDTSVNKGFDAVTGGGGSGTSEYSLLDEYNELMGLWSTNKDANGEWSADWSEGGIGQTLANLIQGKLPGKYWADLTDEDRQRMAGMTASEGYVQGQYETRFRPEVTEPVTVPADLEVVSVAGSEDGETLDLSALSEAIPEETILSWQNLRAAMQGVMDVLSGGEGGAGITDILSNANELMNSSLPGGIQKFSDALATTLPPAVDTALQFLGRVSYDEEGNTIAGKGNTLYTSLGSIYGLFEDTNVQIDLFAQGLMAQIPAAVEVFKNPAGIAQGILEGMFVAARNAADAFFAMADGISAAADALARLNGGRAGGSEGNGTFPEFAAAHGGLERGVGIVGERGPEVVSTSRNINVFTNRALEIAQAKIADRLSRGSYTAALGGQRISNVDNSRTSTVNVGTVLGSDWLGNEIDRRIRRIVERGMFYAG